MASPTLDKCGHCGTTFDAAALWVVDGIAYCSLESIDNWERRDDIVKRLRCPGCRLLLPPETLNPD